MNLRLKAAVEACADPVDRWARWGGMDGQWEEQLAFKLAGFRGAIMAAKGEGEDVAEVEALFKDSVALMEGRGSVTDIRERYKVLLERL